MKSHHVALPQRPQGLRFEIEAYADTRFAADVEAGVITIFEPITDETTNRIAAALRSIGPRPIAVKLNSLGGDPFAGLTIYNLLRAHGRPIRTEVLGTAASAASLIQAAGDTRLMARSASLMIHRASGGALGTAEDLLAMAEALASIDAAMASLYADRTGRAASEIAALMTRETWLDPSRAVEMGFADGILDTDAVPAPQRRNDAVGANAGQPPADKRELEERLRAMGFSRSIAARMTSAAWAARDKDDPAGMDLSAVAATLDRHAGEIKSLFRL
jgi:ATP-dependent protease ClpP protease subunit